MVMKLDGSQGDLDPQTKHSAPDRAASRGATEALQALDFMFEGIQIISPDWTYTFVNRTAAIHGKRTSEELIGRRMSEVYPGIESTPAFSMLQECMRSREPKSMFSEFTYPDGSQGWFELRFSPVPSGVLILSIDITELKNHERALWESKEDLQTTLSCMAEAVITTDAEGRIVRMNPSAETLTGWTLQETKGRPLSEVVRFLREADGAVMENTVQIILREGLRVGLANHTLLVTRSGATIPIASSGAPIADAHGNTRGVVMVLQDMREESRLLRQLNQAQKMEAIGRLAGGVAHDFNNILTAILSFSGFAADGIGKDDPAYEDIQEVIRAAERAESLTRQLLAFSRKQTIAPRVFNPNELLASIDRMLRRLLGEDIEILTLLADDLGNITMDPGAFEQVLMNLAVNARDAMPTGGKLTIETSNVELTESYASRSGGDIPAGEYVVLAISDNGVGMDRKTQDKIFEPFFTTKEVGKGTGLGLSTCYGIIKQASGYIWVYSEVGKGTTFKIYLPRARDAAHALPTERRSLILHGDETVLVVEDDEQVRQLVVRTLERFGYTVLAATTGEEALVMLGAHDNSVQLLLTDIVMPKMSGRELSERMRMSYPSLKVLYMSGYTPSAIVHHGVLDQGMELLQKPFTPDQLAAKVREVLDTNGSLPRAQVPSSSL